MGEIGKAQPIKEQLDLTAMGGGGSYSIDPDSGQSDFPFYRRIEGKAMTDIMPLVHDRMQEIALMLYRTNPLGHRILELTASFAVGGNVVFEASDEKVQKILEDHWNHPINDWDRKLYGRIFELGLYGELFLTTKVADNGDVTLGYISPLRVKSVTPDEITGDPKEVILKGAAVTANDEVLQVIRFDADPKSKTSGYRTGDVFFFAVNQVMDMVRGLSDLLPLTEYIDGIDQFMINELERTAHQSSWIWDVSLEGMSEQDIKNWLANFHSSPPKQGAVRAHNERVTWQALAPNIQGTELTEEIRLLRNFVLGGAGLPEYFFGESRSGGRATTQEMAEPTYKCLSQRQHEAKLLVRDVFNFLIDQKIQKKELPKDVDRNFFINLPQISIRDFSRNSAALRSAAQGLDLLLKDGLIEVERGARIADDLLSQLDMEGDVDKSRVESALQAKKNAADAALEFPQKQPIPQPPAGNQPAGNAAPITPITPQKGSAKQSKQANTGMQKMPVMPNKM